MSISDSSGVSSTRPDDANRADSTRTGGGSARYQSAGLDPGSPGGPPPDSTSDPFDGASAGGESRPCAKVVWWDEWHTQEDERVCPECGPLDKQWFEHDKGPVPPLHDNCRCWREVVWWDCYQSDGTWADGGRPQ